MISGNNGGADPAMPDEGLLAVNIRAGGVNGPILAASSPVYIPPFFHGDVLLRFSAPVPLDPGHLYALEPYGLAPGKNWLFDASEQIFDPGYSGGRLFFNGRFDDNHDLLFREGIGVPEPAPWVLIAVGLGTTATALAWSKARRHDQRTRTDGFHPAGLGIGASPGLCCAGSRLSSTHRL